MRDRYLFKAKRIDNGEWVEGFVARPFSRNAEGNITNYCFNALDEMGFVSECIVSADTICQYTGLTDKNGNKIWENDILSISKKMDSLGTYYFPAVKYPVNVSVKWDLCAWMWETIAENKHYISFPDAWCHYEAEVIGNAFDNTELLKGE